MSDYLIDSFTCINGCVTSGIIKFESEIDGCLGGKSQVIVSDVISGSGAFKFRTNIIGCARKNSGDGVLEVLFIIEDVSSSFTNGVGSNSNSVRSDDIETLRSRTVLGNFSIFLSRTIFLGVALRERIFVGVFFGGGLRACFEEAENYLSLLK